MPRQVRWTAPPAPFPLRVRLPRLLVCRVLGAPPAELPVLNAPGLLFLVLGGGVVPPLAVGTLEGYDVSHDGTPFLRWDDC